MNEQPQQAYYNPEDITQREMMDDLHKLSEEAQKQYFDERNPDFLNYKGFKALLDRRVAELESKRPTESLPFLRVVFADLNKLKQINDTYGHQAGNMVIASVIEILKKFNPKVEDRPLYLEDFVRQPVISARHTRGDEFTLLISGMDAREADQLVVALQEKLASRAVEVAPGKTIPLSVSFGAADWAPGKTPESLLGEADKAMYSAKQTGNN